MSSKQQLQDYNKRLKIIIKEKDNIIKAQDNEMYSLRDTISTLYLRLGPQKPKKKSWFKNIFK